MRLCRLCLVPLLSACSPPLPDPIVQPPSVPQDLLVPCPGYRGLVPRTEGQLSDALLAEAQGRACANGRLATLAEILTDPDPP
jgi:hypothetical protein